MGCLKLSYCSDATLPKVMYGKSVLSKKSAQIWIIVDPMSDKYPSLSPYAYCANNPVILVDPNGMDWEENISDHVDMFGNVIAHYDDGDNSVYMHKNGTTKSDIDQQRAANHNTGGNGQKIGELGGKVDMSAIFKNKLSQSASEAKDMNLLDYYEAVKTKEDWDLKNNTNTIWGVAWEYDKNNETQTFFSCSRFSGANAADVGNYHAGYTGVFADIPNYILWKGAGAAETFKSFKGGNIGDGLKRAFSLINPINFTSGDRNRDFFYNTIGMDAAMKEKK